MDLLPVSIAFFALLIMSAGVFLGWQGHKFIERIERLEAVAKRQRLPNPAADGLEDAMAIANDGRFQNGDMDQVIATLLTALNKSEATRAYMDKRFGQLLTVLQTVRSDPHGYNSDKPNQKEQI